MKKVTVIGIVLCMLLLFGIIFFGVFFAVDEISIQFENDVTLTDKTAVMNAIEIEKYANIFALDEDSIKEDVEKTVEGNGIEVVNVVRNFPNDVTVIIRERTPVYKIAIEESDQFVAPDKDFRRTNKYTAEELDGVDIITVKNYSVKNTLATEECYCLRSIAKELLTLGFTDSSLVVFIKEASFEEDSVILTTFDGAYLVVQKGNVVPSLDAAYAAYCASAPSARTGRSF